MTETTPTTQVVIRECWIVQTIKFDENGEGHLAEDLEFFNKAEAIVQAAKQADRYEVDITYDWNG